MELDPQVLKQLTETFQIELEERLQVITEGLLLLEKNPSGKPIPHETIEILFRAAHNIKGTARGIGINTVSEIAHHMETLFVQLQKGNCAMTPALTDLCFWSVDCIRLAMVSFVENIPLPFDLTELIKALGTNQKKTAPRTEIKKTAESFSEKMVPVQPTDNESIRVSLANLDRVSALMEEFQVNKIAIDDHYTELLRLTPRLRQLDHLWKQLQESIGTTASDTLKKQCHAQSDSLVELENTISQMQKTMRPRINELAILSAGLQDEVRLLRLVPAATLLRTLPRQARDLARELGRDVNFDISGDDVRLDRMILEGLKDPFIHLLRNAIDHGIEDPENRKAAGKPERGQIRIDIRDEGSQILFMVSDDGAGIDIDQVMKIAKKNNLISTDHEQLNSEEIFELIFRPGFSTKTMITDVSGRGVGLDVVKTNLEILKGSVTVSSEKGKGTTFYLRVPLTLSSERGLLVKSSGQLFVIPTTDVERALMLKAADIIEVEATQAISLDNHPVPLRTLAGLLGLSETVPANPQRLPIIVVRKGHQPVALLLEEILGEKEIVIKPMQAPLGSIPCIAGGTLSGNGQVIIVLNTGDVIDLALHAEGKTTHTRLQWQGESVKPETRIPVLVVDDSITTRTLEKNILESRNYAVTVATNGQEAWDLLQKQAFSLIVTDVCMPVMDGFTLTERIKQTPALHDLPVIIVTSLGSPEEKKRGIEVGANAYIVKSEFESGNLLEIVEQLV